MDEYKIAQLYMTAKSTRLEAERADGAGIELIKNEPCSHPQHGVGQYTLKHYHFHGKLPGWLKMIVTRKTAILIEESWNYYPYCKTTLSLEAFSKFSVTVETHHLSTLDAPNVHKLSGKKLKIREVVRACVCVRERKRKRERERERERERVCVCVRVCVRVSE